MSDTLLPIVWRWLCDSPILIDALGEGFHLTNAADGVYFDLWADGNIKKFAWTDPAYHNAWLALDRDNNGMIDDGSELFGYSTAYTTTRQDGEMGSMR